MSESDQFRAVPFRQAKARALALCESKGIETTVAHVEYLLRRKNPEKTQLMYFFGLLIKGKGRRKDGIVIYNAEFEQRFLAAIKAEPPQPRGYGNVATVSREQLIPPVVDVLKGK